MRQSFWKKRIRRDKRLSPGAKHLANCLADLHWDAGARDAREEAGITLADLCLATGWTSMNTVRKYRAELTSAGWIEWRPVHLDHRQQPTEYRLTDHESRVQGVNPESRVHGVQGVNPAPAKSRVQTPSVSRVQTFEPRSTKYLLEGVGHEPRSGELVVDDRHERPEPRHARPEPPVDTTRLLDELGIRRRRRA